MADEPEAASSQPSPKPPPPQGRFWTFFNSSLGIWFLSSVVLSLVTFGYSTLTNALAERDLAAHSHAATVDSLRLQIRRLDIEIESRLSQFLVQLEKMSDTATCASRFVRPDSLQRLDTLWESLKHAPCNECTALIVSNYAEFNDRNLVSLMTELRQTLVDYGRVSNRFYDYQIEAGFSNGADSTQGNGDIEKAAVFMVADGIYFNSRKPDFHEVMKSFFENVIIPRWSMRFPYVDCRPDCPFC